MTHTPRPSAHPARHREPVYPTPGPLSTLPAAATARTLPCWWGLPPLPALLPQKAGIGLHRIQVRFLVFKYLCSSIRGGSFGSHWACGWVSPLLTPLGSGPGTPCSLPGSGATWGRLVLGLGEGNSAGSLSDCGRQSGGAECRGSLAGWELSPTPFLGSQSLMIVA